MRDQCLNEGRRPKSSTAAHRRRTRRRRYQASTKVDDRSRRRERVRPCTAQRASTPQRRSTTEVVDGLGRTGGLATAPTCLNEGRRPKSSTVVREGGTPDWPGRWPQRRSTTEVVDGRGMSSALGGPFGLNEGRRPKSSTVNRSVRAWRPVTPASTKVDDRSRRRSNGVIPYARASSRPQRRSTTEVVDGTCWTSSASQTYSTASTKVDDRSRRRRPSDFGLGAAFVVPQRRSTTEVVDGSTDRAGRVGTRIGLNEGRRPKSSTGDVLTQRLPGVTRPQRRSTTEVVDGAMGRTSA